MRVVNVCAALLSSLCIAIAIERNCVVELAITTFHRIQLHKVYSFCRFGRLLCAFCFQPSRPLNFYRQMENMHYKRIKAKRTHRARSLILANLLFFVLAFVNPHNSFNFEFCRATERNCLRNVDTHCA